MNIKRVTGLLVFLSWTLFGSQALAADPRNGAKLYSIHCSSCHGPRGQGAMPGAPDFSRGHTLFVANADLVRSIEQGSGVMPAFRGLLSTEEILDVIAHLRTFQ